MNKDNFIVHVKSEEVSEEIAKHVETKFDRLNYKFYRSLPIRKYKKVIGHMKDELGGRIMKELSALRQKMVVLHK